MCLHQLNETYNPPNQEIGIGWKVFSNNQHKGLVAFWRDFNFPVNQWIDDPCNLNLAVDGELKEFRPEVEEVYPSGFHFFIDKEEADKLVSESFLGGVLHLVVRQIEYTQLVARGMQVFTTHKLDRIPKTANYQVGVAKRIKINEI